MLKGCREASPSQKVLWSPSSMYVASIRPYIPPFGRSGRVQGVGFRHARKHQHQREECHSEDLAATVTQKQIESAQVLVYSHLDGCRLCRLVTGCLKVKF